MHLVIFPDIVLHTLILSEVTATGEEKKCIVEESDRVLCFFCNNGGLSTFLFIVCVCLIHD